MDKPGNAQSSSPSVIGITVAATFVICIATLVDALNDHWKPLLYEAQKHVEPGKTPLNRQYITRLFLIMVSLVVLNFTLYLWALASIIDLISPLSWESQPFTLGFWVFVLFSCAIGGMVYFGTCFGAAHKATKAFLELYRYSAPSPPKQRNVSTHQLGDIEAQRNPSIGFGHFRLDFNKPPLMNKPATSPTTKTDRSFAGILSAFQNTFDSFINNLSKAIHGSNTSNFAPQLAPHPQPSSVPTLSSTTSPPPAGASQTIWAAPGTSPTDRSPSPSRCGIPSNYKALSADDEDSRSFISSRVFTPSLVGDMEPQYFDPMADGEDIRMALLGVRSERLGPGSRGASW